MKYLIIFLVLLPVLFAKSFDSFEEKDKVLPLDEKNDANLEPIDVPEERKKRGLTGKDGEEEKDEEQDIEVILHPNRKKREIEEKFEFSDDFPEENKRKKRNSEEEVSEEKEVENTEKSEGISAPVVAIATDRENKYEGRDGNEISIPVEETTISIDLVKDLTCPDKKLFVSTPENAVDYMNVSVNENFKNIKNNQFVWSSNFTELSSIFKKSDFWYPDSKENCSYPLLVRVKICGKACGKATIKYIQANIVNQENISVRIGSKWFHFKNPKPEDQYTVRIREDIEAQNIDFLIKKCPLSDKSVGLGHVTIITCC